MMQHIDVSNMLRQAVACDLYSNLVTRPTGAAVRAQIQALVGAVPPRSLTVIDFTHVQMIDFSCADEVVAKLLLPYSHGEAADDSYFIFRGLSEDHWDAVEAVLERHGLALLVEECGDAAPRGVLAPEARAAWDAVRSLGAATVDDAAKAGDIVVVTIPLKNYRSVPPAPLAGKIVIDTNNYYPQRDGHIPELDKERSEVSKFKGVFAKDLGTDER